jgi:hypothetical protein
MTSQFTPLILIGSEGSDAQITELPRLPINAKGSGEYDEAFIQNLLFAHPDTLPISEIDNAFAPLIPICTELRSPAGSIDALYVNEKGMITLAEFKLWRNPEARREVIGQILDYAKEMARWDYSDLQREVSRRLGRPGNTLFEVVKAAYPEVDEKQFVDDVSRNLIKGQFLLLIIGDGIREGVESIVGFLQDYTGVQFTMALVEAAIYRLPSSDLIIQPRILARSVIVNRTVIELADRSLNIQDDTAAPQDPEQDALADLRFKFWTEFLSDLALDDTNQKIPSPNRGPNVFFRFGFTNEIWVTCYIVVSGRFGVFVSHRNGSSFGEEANAFLNDHFDELNSECLTDLEFSDDNLVHTGRPAEFLSDPKQITSCAIWLRSAVNDVINVVRPRVERLYERRE